MRRENIPAENEALPRMNHTGDFRGNKRLRPRVHINMRMPAERESQRVYSAGSQELREAEIVALVAAAGASYVGMMDEIPGKTEAIVLFSSRRTKSTLAISISHLTIEAVRAHLAESDEAFGSAAAD